MSRRQRRKTNSSSKEKSQGRGVLKGLWWKLLVGFVVLLVIGGFIVYSKVVSFLHSDGFRDDVAAQVGAELGSRGEFGDFKWDGLSAKNENFKAEGECNCRECGCCGGFR